MNRAFVVCLLLQAVYAGRNISIVVDGPRESPAGVTYVEGNAPEELKAGPVKNSTEPKERITHTAFIHSSGRAIPKDDEIENEEFERFIKRHHNRPTIETVFVSSSPSPLADQESDEYNEESSSLKSEAELFKRPEKSETFQRHVALPSVLPSIHPPSDHGHSYSIVNHPPQEIAVNHGAGGVSYAGNEGIIFQTDGGQYSTFLNGNFLPGNHGQYGGGELYYYHVAQPGLTAAQGTVNIPQHAVKTKTYQIRRPAIQKHYYDIEERVIIRPAGSIVVELDRPVAKIPTGETYVGLQGSQGGFGGVNIQQSQGGFGGIGIQQSQGGFGISQGGFTGVGIQQQQGGIGVSQGGLTGVGIQQQQGGIGVSQVGLTGVGIQQQQGGIGIAQGGLTGVGIQQQQGGIGVSQGGLTGVGIQQQQGGIGISQGGLTGRGIQQQQGGIGVSQGGLAGVGIQQQQGGIGVSQGGLTGVGIQQQQGGIGISQGGLTGRGIQQQQGGIGVSQGGLTGVGIQQQQGGGIQQSQGGISFSTTPVPSVPVGGLQGGLDLGERIGVSQGGFQQSQGGIGVLQSGSQGGYVTQDGQQSQGGISYSTTFAPSASSVGFQQFGGTDIQQSLGGVRYSTTFAPSSSSVSIGGPQGGFSGGFGTQGGGVYSTTTAPFYTPSSPAPTLSIGGSYGGAGFQQSQGGAVGVSQGGLVGVGFQQSQGGVFSSTTPGPFVSKQPGYTSTSSIGLGSQTGSGDSVVVEAKSNVQNKGTFSSSTTTERSFTSSVSQDASAYAKGSSAAGSVQTVSKNITPYMIAVGEPDFHYPPYVQITSNGSPLGHYHQQPYAQIQAPRQSYPRMRYQGQLLTGEVRADDGVAQEQQYTQQAGYGALSQNVAQQKSYDGAAYVAEIPQNTAYEQQEGELQENTQYQQSQFVGSSQQPHQTAQVSSGAHQQPAQVHQHHFVTATSQPVRLLHQQQFEVAGDSQQSTGRYQHPAQVHQASQQHAAQVHSNKPNLVAQIRHQHDAQVERQTAQVEAPVYEYNPAKYQQQYVASGSLPHPAEVTEQSVDIPEVRSSTHRQLSQQQNHPKFHYEKQVASTTHQPEPYNSGQRLYKQRELPSKYTQHHTINVAPAQHNIFFSNQPQQAEGSARSQNLETAPELEGNGEEDSVRTANVEPTTKSAPLISSTTPNPSPVDNAPQYQHQTYASVLAGGKPGILYATSPVPRHQPHHTPFLRFTSQSSSLFAPNGRQVHLVYSQPPRSSHSPQIAPTGAAAESSGHHITLQAQTPISHQKQIELTATGPASEPEQPPSQYQQNAPISSTTPAASVNTNDHNEARGHQKYRNEQTHSALTLRSGRTYGNHRVIASTPAPSDGGAASESVQTRRIVVNHPFQTVQEVVEQEPITGIRQPTVNGSAQVHKHDALQAATVQSPKESANQESISNVRQVAVNEQAQAYRDGPQPDQQKAAYRHPTAAYKVAATFNHPAASLSFHNGGSH